IVVLPASMCAAMPMFRVRSSGNLRFGEFGPADVDFFFSSVAGINLPTKMGKRTVRLRHFVCVFAFLNCVAQTGCRVLNFLGERRTPVTGIDALFLFVNSLPSRHCRSFVSKIYIFSSFGAASFAPAAGFAPPPPPPAPPFGRFAPYLERLRRRPSTPNESSVPRTMW